MLSMKSLPVNGMMLKQKYISILWSKERPNLGKGQVEVESASTQFNWNSSMRYKSTNLQPSMARCWKIKIFCDLGNENEILC